MKQQYINSDILNAKEEEESYNLKKWFFKMLRLWPWFLTSLLFCISLTYLYLSYVNPTYQAVASMMVKDATKGELLDDSKMKDMGLAGNNKLVVNEIEILKSYDLMQDVVDSLQLNVSVKHVERLRNVPLFGDEIPFIIELKKPISINKPLHWKVSDSSNLILFKSEHANRPILIKYGEFHEFGGIKFRFLPRPEYIPSAEHAKAEYKVDLFSPHDAAIQYSMTLGVEPASKLATVINLELKDDNQKRASTVLNTLLYLYNRHGLESKNRITDYTIDFLNDRLETVANELRSVESSVERFKSENRVTNLSEDANQYMAVSQQVDAQKAQSQTQMNIISALERDLQVNQENPKLVPSALGIQDGSLTQLIEKHNTLVLERERLQQNSGPKNPVFIDVDNQIREIRRRLLTVVSNLKQGYMISLNDISRKDDQLSSRIRNVPQLEKKFVQITRSQNVQEQLYTFLLQKREEASVSRASNIENAQTIVNAHDMGAVSPKRNIIWAIGVIMGFMIPVTLFKMKDFTNNKVGDLTQVEQRTETPLLGVISHVKKLKSSVVINSHSRSAVAEQIRNIRTAINFTGKGKKVKTILISSFQPGDGKSFISLNLAAGYSLMDKKTVLLEFDLRRPQISKDLGLEVELGINSILNGKSTIDDVLIDIEGYDGHLSYIPAGAPSSNPAELISGAKCQCMIKALQERFDHIIIDTPPLSLVADASLLQVYADITLIVLRQDHTSREVYKELKQRLDRYPDNPLYLILNDVGKKKVYQGKYGYGGYGYGLGKGYYQEG